MLRLNIVSFSKIARSKLNKTEINRKIIAEKTEHYQKQLLGRVCDGHTLSKQFKSFLMKNKVKLQFTS